MPSRKGKPACDDAAKHAWSLFLACPRGCTHAFADLACDPTLGWGFCTLSAELSHHPSYIA